MINYDIKNEIFKSLKSSFKIISIKIKTKILYIINISARIFLCFRLSLQCQHRRLLVDLCSFQNLNYTLTKIGPDMYKINRKYQIQNLSRLEVYIERNRTIHFYRNYFLVDSECLQTTTYSAE